MLMVTEGLPIAHTCLAKRLFCPWRARPLPKVLKKTKGGTRSVIIFLIVKRYIALESEQIYRKCWTLEDLDGVCKNCSLIAIEN